MAYPIKYYNGISWETISQAAVDSSQFYVKSTDLPNNRNLLINSAMQVHQRATSVSGITTNDFRTVDHWRFNVASTGTWTATVENDGPAGTGLTKSAKFLVTSATASPTWAAFEQAFEGQDLQRIAKGTVSAQPLTLSFWVKSNVTGTYVVNLYDLDNTRSVSAQYIIASSGTWEKKVITFPSDSVGLLDNNNDASMFVAFGLGFGSAATSGTLNTTWQTAVTANRFVGQVNVAASTNNYWQITGAQLECGLVATTFEFEPFESTLRKCQRYFCKSYSTNTNPGSTDVGLISGNIPGALNTGLKSTGVYFPVTMRTAPNVTLYDSVGNINKVAVDFIGSRQNNVNGIAYFIGDKNFMAYTNEGINCAAILLHYTASAEF